MNIVPPVLSPRSQSVVAPPPIPPKAISSNITASVESIASQDTSDRSDSGKTVLQGITRGFHFSLGLIK